MRGLLWALQIVSMVACSPVDLNRYLIDSQPLMFLKETEANSQIVNSTLVLKKKVFSSGPVYYNNNKKDGIINNHHIDSSEAVVWRRPVKPLSAVISNHKGGYHWNRNRWPTRTTKLPAQIAQKPFQTKKEVLINNHSPAAPIKSRPQRPSSWVSVLDRKASTPPTDVIGDRVKLPDTIKSAAIKVLDAPSNVRTTIKHNKIIVIQKRTDGLSSNSIDDGPTTTTVAPIKTPDRGNFSVAAVMDHWSNIPIPSSPSWAKPSKPIKGGISRPVSAQTVVPNLPFMSFLSSLIAPLLNKPLTSSAVNSGMQGIKAMQGFLRNSLMGAMFCFLPSAFIALSLTATQRAQLRKIPEVDEMMFFCKKCIENLKEMKEFADSKELKWLDENIE